MDVDSWLGVVLILSSALVLFLTAASSAAGLFTGRRPHRLLSGRVAARPEHVLRFVYERERLLASLVLARTIAIVVGSVSAAALVMRHTGVSGGAALAVVAVAIVVAGVLEGIPRVIVSHNPDRWHDLIYPITAVIHGALFVPSWLVDLPGRALLRIPPFLPAPPEEDEEEIVRLVELEESQGGIEEDERKMIRAVFKLEETTAREIMVPRMDIAGVDTSASLQDVAALIAERGFSRIPLYDGSIDNVVGVIYAKDVLAQFAQERAEPADPRAIARPPLFVPESKRVDELLSELRDRRIHMAIVVDEYGGTSGLLTIEDLVEEIVGEIEDEYDHGEPSVVRTEAGEAVVDAREHVDILRELFDVEVEPDGFDTVGGFIIHRLGKIPAPNDSVDVDGLQLRVLSVTGRRIRKVRISRLESAPVSPSGG